MPQLGCVVRHASLKYWAMTRDQRVCASGVTYLPQASTHSDHTSAAKSKVGIDNWQSSRATLRTPHVGQRMWGNALTAPWQPPRTSGGKTRAACGGTHANGSQSLRTCTTDVPHCLPRPGSTCRRHTITHIVYNKNPDNNNITPSHHHTITPSHTITASQQRTTLAPLLPRRVM
jgi:hypothetical protein